MKRARSADKTVSLRQATVSQPTHLRAFHCRESPRPQASRRRIYLPPGRAHRPRKRSVIEGCPRHGTGRPCGAGREGHPGSGRHASQPGTSGSVAVVRVFALRLTAPLARVCSSGGAQPRPPSTLPACAGTQGAVGACVFATALHSPPGGGLLSAAGSAAHAHGPLCASACNVIWPPAARVAFPPCARRTACRSHGAAVVGLRACVSRAHRRRQSHRPQPQRSRGDPQAAPR